jgi:uncharacterized protein (TIGR03435 family)
MDPGTDYRMRGGPGTDDPGRIDYPQVFLVQLLTMAYGVGQDQISGPDWLTQGQRYNVTATMRPDTTKAQFALMLQRLLVERFHLALHHEGKQISGYDLVVAQGGPKMKPSPPDGGSAPASAGRAEEGPAGRAQDHTDQMGFPLLPPGRSWAAAYQGGMVRVTARMTMSQFAERVGLLVNESNGAVLGDPEPRVTDKTGLAGKYDFTLEFAGLLPAPANIAAMLRASQPEAGGPTVFAALEKQLGLKLVKGNNASLDILVIDHIEKIPTAN